MTPHLLTLHGCTIMKAESVRNEGARQEGLAAPLRTDDAVAEAALHLGRR